MTHTKKPSPLVGEGVSGANERGKREQKRKKRFLQNDSKYRSVILERSEESRQSLEILNVLSCTLCRILR